MVSLASRLPDIELLPGDGPPRPAPGPRRTVWPQPAWRTTAPALRLAAPAAAPVVASPPPPAAALDLLEVPAFLRRPRPLAPAGPALPAPPAAPLRPRPRRRGPGPGRVRIGGAAAALAGLAAAVALALAGGGETSRDAPAPATQGAALTAAAVAEIPADYLALYRRFGAEMDIDWRFLAAIGGQESDHGRNRWAARVNAQGCVGPMQLGVGGRCGDFVGAWGVDGDGDGRVDPLAPADAIATAARGLRQGKGAPAAGGPADAYRRAACGYYGACSDARADYADEVMARAARYGFPGR